MVTERERAGTMHGAPVSERAAVTDRWRAVNGHVHDVIWQTSADSDTTPAGPTPRPDRTGPDRPSVTTETAKQSVLRGSNQVSRRPSVRRRARATSLLAPRASPTDRINAGRAFSEIRGTASLIESDRRIENQRRRRWRFICAVIYRRRLFARLDASTP